jgi:4-amino-4-deoxy-L-arabinose transferase-like glycosyltransferase
MAGTERRPSGLSVTAFRTAFTATLILGICILAIATRWGIGLYPDSIVYIGAVRSVLAGHGFQFLDDIGELSAVTQYPPGYSWLIAALAWNGLDALEAARWVSIFFAAVNSVLVGFIAYRSTGSYATTLIALFLSFAAFPMVYINSQALSEPPFIFLILLGCCFLARYLQQSDRAALYWFAFCVGVSCLVRYVGIAFGLTGAAIIFFHSRRAWRQRFLDAATFSVLAALPIVAWVARNYLQAGNAVNRTFGFHLPSIADLLPSVDTAAHWLLPAAIVETAPWPSRIFLLTVFLVLFWLARHLDWSKTWYPRLMIYSVAGYASFLFISFSFNDQPLYFDTRTMALPYAATMIVALAIMTEWLRKKRSKDKSWRWFGFDCALVFLLALQLVNGALWLQLSYASGIGFAIDSWRRSELINFVKTVPESAPIVSNAPDFIYTLAARRTTMIPHKVHPWTRQPNEHYGQAITAIGEQMKQPDAALVYFNDENRLWYLPSIKELEGQLQLEKITTAADGAVYRLNGPSVAREK